MAAADVVDRLADHKTIGGAPRSELEWLAAHGSLRHLNTGEVLTPKGKSVEGLLIVLSGRISISVDRGTGPHKIMEWRQGDVTGLLPYSRMVSPPADTIAEESSEVFAVPRDQLHTMIRECYTATSILVHTMVDRARVFNAADLHDEKMMSLGKLSAGLAHELNNPAAAIERSASLLEHRMEESETAGRALGGARLSEGQLAALDAVRTSCMPTRERVVRSPLAQAERFHPISGDHEQQISRAEGHHRAPDGFVLRDLAAWNVRRRAHPARRDALLRRQPAERERQHDGQRDGRTCHDRAHTFPLCRDEAIRPSR